MLAGMKEHDKRIEQAASEIYALVERLEAEGVCPDCPALLLVLAAAQTSAESGLVAH